MFIANFFCVSLALTGLFNNVESCVNEELELFEQGVTPDDIKTIVNEHNRYRQAIMDGKVPGQPRGVGLNYLRWDEKLASSAQEVADRCIFRHKHVLDDRWRYAVGQNLFRAEAADFQPRNYSWTRATARWFMEHKYYHYGNINRRLLKSGHYTTMIWAKTQYIGCGYTAYENDRPSSDNYVAQLYVCHYGPPGNIKGEYPYRRADDEGDF